MESYLGFGTRPENPVKPMQHFGQEWSISTEQSHGRKGMVVVAPSQLESPHLRMGGDDIFRGTQEALRRYIGQRYPGARIKMAAAVHAGYQDWQGRWVHYSRLPMMKINPRAFHQDPLGIYLFPERFNTSGSWRTFPYRYTVETVPGIRVLDWSGLSRRDCLDLIVRLGATPEHGAASQYGDKIVAQEYPEFVETIETKERFLDATWEWLTRFFGRRQAATFNRRLRDAGYDAVFDDTGSIHSSEVQLLVLDPTKVKVIEQVEQRGSGFQELNQVLGWLDLALKRYGQVKVEAPRLTKDMWGPERRLRGQVSVDDGSRSAVWEASVDRMEGRVADQIGIHLKRSSPAYTEPSGHRRSAGRTWQLRELTAQLVQAAVQHAMDDIWARPLDVAAKAKAQQTKQVGRYRLELLPWSVQHPDPKHHDYRIEAFLHDKSVGVLLVSLHGRKLSAAEIDVDPAHRRRGLASAMFDWAEQLSGRMAVPSPEDSEELFEDRLSEDAQRFWEARWAKQNDQERTPMTLKQKIESRYQVRTWEVVADQTVSSDDAAMAPKLQAALKAEYLQLDLYQAYRDSLTGEARNALLEEFDDHAEDERQHIATLQQWLVAMDYEPTKERDPVPGDALGNREILKLQLDHELAAVAIYREIVESLKDGSPLKVDLENILAKEQEHARDLAVTLKGGA